MRPDAMATLLEDIQAKCSPELLASRDCVAIAAKVNETRTRPSSLEIGNGTVLETIGLTAGNALLDAIYNGPDFRYVRPLLEQGRLKAASPLIAGALAGLVQANVIQQAHADALLALGRELDPISEFEVRQACWSDEGQWLAGD